jgi:long-chain acyl-CoA synthetase
MATSAEIQAVVDGQTVPAQFLRTVQENADRTALRWRDEDGSWGEWTFAEYAEKVALAAAGLRERGVGPGTRVVLMLRNIPEFHVIDMAVYFCGGTAVSIYNSSAPEQIAYLAGHCEARVAFVEDVGFLESFLKVRDELPALEHIGILRDPDGIAPGDVFSWESLLGSDPLDLDEAATVAKPEDLATVIYTSGTTGPPKGVMISHQNIAWTVESLKRCIAFDDFAGKRLVSYLPMAHIAERMTSHYQQAFLGYEVTACPNPGDIAVYAREVRPQLMFGVPRVWEKLHAGVMGSLAADPEKEAKFSGAVEAAKPLVEAIDWERATDEQVATYQAMDGAVFANVRAMLGLDAVEAAITGAAPIPAELLMWFRAIGIPLSEIYGMSESSGPMTWTARQIKAGTVGPAIPGCEVKLADEDDEIICRGGNVFQGYLNDPEKTAETIDADGWLHSGDIGKVDEDGYFSVVDRKKELIITAGGKNLSPANLEANLKLIPLVGQACAIGDNRPFVSALVVLDPEVAVAWARNEGVEFTDLNDLAQTSEVQVEIEGGLTEVMAGFNNAERVKKVVILGEEWLPDSEELTPTSKLKRRGIHAKYAEEIESIYA